MSVAMTFCDFWLTPEMSNLTFLVFLSNSMSSLLTTMSELSWQLL